MKVIYDAKTYKIDEITKTKSLKKNLFAINSIDLKSNSVYTTDFLNIVYSTTIIEQILNLIEKFRHVIRIKKENKASFKFHFAFFVDENFIFIFISSSFSNARSKEKNKRLSFRKKSIELFQCVYEKKY